MTSKNAHGLQIKTALNSANSESESRKLSKYWSCERRSLILVRIYQKWQQGWKYRRLINIRSKWIHEPEIHAVLERIRDSIANSWGRYPPCVLAAHPHGDEGRAEWLQRPFEATFRRNDMGCSSEVRAADSRRVLAHASPGTDMATVLTPLPAPKKRRREEMQTVRAGKGTKTNWWGVELDVIAETTLTFDSPKKEGPYAFTESLLWFICTCAKILCHLWLPSGVHSLLSLFSEHKSKPTLFILRARAGFSISTQNLKPFAITR